MKRLAILLALAGLVGGCVSATPAAYEHDNRVYHKGFRQGVVYGAKAYVSFSVVGQTEVTAKELWKRAATIRHEAVERDREKKRREASSAD